MTFPNTPWTAVPQDDVHTAHVSDANGRCLCRLTFNTDEHDHIPWPVDEDEAFCRNPRIRGGFAIWASFGVVLLFLGWLAIFILPFWFVSVIAWVIGGEG